MMQAASVILTWWIAGIAIPGLLASKSEGGYFLNGRAICLSAMASYW